MKIKNLKVSPLTFAIANTGFVCLMCGLCINGAKISDNNTIPMNQTSFISGMAFGAGLSYDAYWIKSCLKKSKNENNEEEMQNLNKQKVR